MVNRNWNVKVLFCKTLGEEINGVGFFSFFLKVDIAHLIKCFNPSHQHSALLPCNFHFRVVFTSAVATDGSMARTPAGISTCKLGECLT